LLNVVALQVVDETTLAISLSARGIGELGYVAMGWGGLTMASAEVRTAPSLGNYLLYHTCGLSLSCQALL